MARKDDQTNSQFDTGFGGGTFGGTSGGGSPKSQAQMGGEFSSGFGGGTNAVSQIFRDSGPGGDDKRRKMVMALLFGVVVVTLGYAGYIFFFEGDAASEEPIVVTTPAPKATSAAGTTTDSNAVADAKPTAAAAASDEAVDEEEEEGEEEELVVETQTPDSASTYAYNEMGGGPIVQASPGTAIEVSRKQDFSEMYITGTVNASGQLRIPNPPPGKVYWRVAGKPDVTEITVTAPPKLNLAMNVGASIGASETLQWSANGDVAHYRLELASDANFTSIAHSFSTNKSQLALSGVNPGNYFIRVGGLNVAAGRWEFTRGSAVEVK